MLTSSRPPESSSSVLAADAKCAGCQYPRPDRHEWLERRGPRRQRSTDCQRVGTSPAGAEQGAAPAVLLGQLRQLGEPLQAVVPLDSTVTPMPRRDLVGDVPEEFQTHVQTLQPRTAVDGSNHHDAKEFIPTDLLAITRLTN